MHPLIRPDLATLEPYTPIVPFEVLSQQLGRSPADIVKLDANENPYGPAPSALAALRNGEFFHIYPDPGATALRQALAATLDYPADRLVCGLGADELIDLVLRAIITPGDVVVDCPPTFGMYPFSTAVNGGRCVRVWRDARFRLDPAAIRQAVLEHGAKVLFLCSPNNPDGSVIDDDTLRELLTLPCLVVLDEAYVDFSAVEGHGSRLAWSLEHDNLAVLRTFSKLAGLAGLRIGYGGFPEWLVPVLMGIKQPYNVTVSADIAARAALEDGEWLARTTRALVQERERMVAELARFPFLQPFPSHANFVLFRVVGRDAAALKQALAQEGILVRHFAKPGVDNCIRISAGRPQDTDRLVAALARL
jgi:histidinol-phosphate aminotransferase